ncbi:hypothetical protein AXF42_Ash013483 [Apostasia shenzhenica]|uniref:Uncharacterized protein n=1 Tax=Apostasia shenzhenica TaxID=1088818 RepID=A0A2I0A4C6_9ASPA|nr:hypothetical protein AXF42_Ash013483 [Apostasia shenzhenica]
MEAGGQIKAYLQDTLIQNVVQCLLLSSLIWPWSSTETARSHKAIKHNQHDLLQIKVVPRALPSFIMHSGFVVNFVNFCLFSSHFWAKYQSVNFVAIAAPE